MQHFIERLSKLFAGPTPSPDLFETKRCRTAELRWVKTLVHDRIPPGIQLLQLGLAVRVAGILTIDLGPEIDTESAKIRAEASRLGVTSVELSVPCELLANDRL